MAGSLQVSIIRITGDSARPGPDLLAIEEPLEIRLAFGDSSAGQPDAVPGNTVSGNAVPGNTVAAGIRNLAVTMRTPGNDSDLALGFLFTEGIIRSADEVQAVNPVFLPCSENQQNTILVTLKAGVKPNLHQAERNFYTTSSCGVCGKASISAITTVSAFKAATWDRPLLDPAFLLDLPDRLIKAQEVFAGTGGLHAAALFDDTGESRLVREDVGRHNAVDKLIGASLTSGRVPLATSILLLSGRASFELVQKAAMAGIPVIAAVGAPSSLAVSLAAEFGITLIGFLRNNRFNIYSGAHRINIPAPKNTLV